MAAITQLGATLKIGFGTNVYTGYIMEDFSTDPSGVQDVILDEDAATTTILVSDLGNQISFSAIIMDAGSLTPPAMGSSVTINAVLYRTETSSVKQSRKASILTFTGIKEASMTYS